MTDSRLDMDGEGAMFLMPPDPRLCQVCAREHTPEEPHDPTTMYAEMRARMRGEPVPSWRSAMEHCAPDVQARWTAELSRRGFDLDAPGGRKKVTK